MPIAAILHIGRRGQNKLNGNSIAVGHHLRLAAVDLHHRASSNKNSNKWLKQK